MKIKQITTYLLVIALNFFFISCNNESNQQNEDLIEIVEETKSVPFSDVFDPPIYPGCEDATDIRKCMSKKITQHVSKSFNVTLANNLKLATGKHRIHVQFQIDKQGNVADIKVRAPHVELEEEAKRIIKLLPKMKPGKQDGKAVNVRYNLPIIFNVEK